MDKIKFIQYVQCRRYPLIQIIENEPDKIQIKCDCSYIDIILIDDYIQSIHKINSSISFTELNCSKHEQNPFQLYCKTCHKHFCYKCTNDYINCNCKKKLFQLHWFANPKRIGIIKENIEKVKEYLNIYCNKIKDIAIKKNAKDLEIIDDIDKSYEIHQTKKQKIN